MLMKKLGMIPIKARRFLFFRFSKLLLLASCVLRGSNDRADWIVILGQTRIRQRWAVVDGYLRRRLLPGSILASANDRGRTYVDRDEHHCRRRCTRVIFAKKPWTGAHVWRRDSKVNGTKGVVRRRRGTKLRMSDAPNNYAHSLVSEGRSGFFTRDKVGPTRS